MKIEDKINKYQVSKIMVSSEGTLKESNPELGLILLSLGKHLGNIEKNSLLDEGSRWNTLEQIAQRVGWKTFSSSIKDALEMDSICGYLTLETRNAYEYILNVSEDLNKGAY